MARHDQRARSTERAWLCKACANTDCLHCVDALLEKAKPGYNAQQGLICKCKHPLKEVLVDDEDPEELLLVRQSG